MYTTGYVSSRAENCQYVYEKDDVNYYRSISILSKILKALIKTRFINFLECNNCLNKNKHAYFVCRENRTTITSLLEVTEMLTTFDHSEDTNLALLDLSKAFDPISH